MVLLIMRFKVSEKFRWWDSLSWYETKQSFWIPHIEKIMFLFVIGVPQTVSHDGWIFFDAKIAIFPFIE